MLKKNLLPFFMLTLGANIAIAASHHQLVSSYTELARILENGHTIQAVIRPESCVESKFNVREKKTNKLSINFTRLWQYTPEKERTTRILAFDNTVIKSPD